MAGELQSGADAIRMHVDDHVATALRDLMAGEIISLEFSGKRLQIEMAEDVAFGHKVALVPIPKGTLVKKYGEVIGRATEEIAPGRHVHVHNIEGVRGRGDQVREGAKA